MNYKSITQDAAEIDASIRIKKDVFGRRIYEIEYKFLDDSLKKTLQEEENSFREKVTTEMRHTDTIIAVQCCADVATFSKTLLASNIPDRLKIALFGKFNIFGFMFDRNRRSYVACHDILKGFLDSVNEYKSSLPPEDLQIWNDSTYGGADQVPFFRGYLQGINAR